MMVTRLSLVVTLAPATGIAPSLTLLTTVPSMKPRVSRVPATMVVSGIAPAANAASLASIALLTPNRGTLVIGMGFWMTAIIEAADPAPVPVLTHRRLLVRASSTMPTSPKVIPPMLTLSKLQAQPLVPQLVAEVSRAPPASGAAFALASTVTGSTTATSIMLKLAAAFVSSPPAASACGDAVPDTVTLTPEPPAPVVPPAPVAPPTPPSAGVLLLLLQASRVNAPRANSPDRPSEKCSRIMVQVNYGRCRVSSSWGPQTASPVTTVCHRRCAASGTVAALEPPSLR